MAAKFDGFLQQRNLRFFEFHFQKQRCCALVSVVQWLRRSPVPQKIPGSILASETFMSNISATCQSHVTWSQRVPCTKCSMLRQVKDPTLGNRDRVPCFGLTVLFHSSSFINKSREGIVVKSYFVGTMGNVPPASAHGRYTLAVPNCIIVEGSPRILCEKMTINYENGKCKNTSVPASHPWWTIIPPIYFTNVQYVKPKMKDTPLVPCCILPEILPLIQNRSVFEN